MNSSANVKLRYEKCLQVWGNAIYRYHAWKESICIIATCTSVT